MVECHRFQFPVKDHKSWGVGVGDMQEEEGTALNQTDFVQRNRNNSFSSSALNFSSLFISNCTRNS